MISNSSYEPIAYSEEGEDFKDISYEESYEEEIEGEDGDYGDEKDFFYDGEDNLDSGDYADDQDSSCQVKTQNEIKYINTSRLVISQIDMNTTPTYDDQKFGKTVPIY